MVTAAQMQDLAAKLGLKAFDLMVVTDGSGGMLGSPCGWAWLSYEAATGQVRSASGGATSGTTNYAELEPVVHALWHYQAGRLATARRPRVEIVSDSEWVVRSALGIYRATAHRALWASIEWFRREGYHLGWTHIRRDSNQANVEADRLAGLTRLSLENVR